MKQYGIDNVRGGSYVKETLDSTQRELLLLEIRNASDVCMGCGRTGHFINQCLVVSTSTTSATSTSTSTVGCPTNRRKKKLEFNDDNHHRATKSTKFNSATTTTRQQCNDVIILDISLLNVSLK